MSIVSVWEDLKQLTNDVVAEMNRAEDLRSKTGGLEFRFADDEMIISNHVSSGVDVNPTSGVTTSMNVTIRLRSELIQVQTRIVIEGAEPSERETWETFAFQSAESGASSESSSSLRTREGEELTIEQAVFHILRPFLHLQATAH